MRTQLQTLYRDFRKHSPFMLVGSNAQQALEAARTILRFRELEDMGYVRLRAQFDDDVDVSWMSDRERENWDGEAYGSISEFKCVKCGTWQQADSVWGHIGYNDVLSPFENPYIVSIMQAAIEAFDGSKTI